MRNWNLSGQVSLPHIPLCIHPASACFSPSLLPTHQEPNRHILAAVSCTGTSVQWSRL